MIRRWFRWWLLRADRAAERRAGEYPLIDRDDTRWWPWGAR